ncbi:ABC transporter ATP-binding protein [Streptosporangium sp. V21-05]|uniref:ABC transporter ATP-binding protein n=1 Tax=Streptosporangium sp. V21-05 TaxID=3446115 RepID=UPI003F538A00
MQEPGTQNPVAQHSSARDPVAQEPGARDPGARDPGAWDPGAWEPASRAPAVRAGRRPVIELSGAEKSYPGGVRALRGVDLRVEAGELVAIVGPSGSGKSTMLHLIGTLDRPSAGTVRIAGHDAGTLPDRELSALRARHIGFVFQRFHLAAGVSALDNVADGMLYGGTPRRERRERAAEALGRVGLGHRLAHRPHELSGGECQRVAVARAVAGGPSLLLADEPTGNLDSSSGRDVLAILRELNASGTTVAIITHDEEVAAAAPRRVRLRDGVIVADERPLGATRAPRTENARDAGSTEGTGSTGSTGSTA